MTVADLVASGQGAAEALMVDSCTITRAGTGPKVFDSTTGTYTDPAATPVYTGKCRVKPSNLSADRVVQAGEQQVALWPYSVSVPVSVLPQLDDVVTVTDSLDPSLTGLTFRVRSVARGTYITARRLDCEEEGS